MLFTYLTLNKEYIIGYLSYIESGIRRVWRYNRRNQNPWIKGQTKRWSQEKRTNNDLQTTTQKTKDRATRTPQSTNIRQTMIYKTLHRKH